MKIVNEVKTKEEIADILATLRAKPTDRRLTSRELLDLIAYWGEELGSQLTIPGFPFIKMWLRKANLESILKRELGINYLDEGWNNHSGISYGFAPLGLVGHWTAANVPIQPALSLSCALLSGNSSVVRVPKSLIEVTELIAKPILTDKKLEKLKEKTAFIYFPSDNHGLHQAMAEEVDSAYIWGGLESVSYVRSLPFSHWTRINVFGPRTSLAVIDKGVLAEKEPLSKWCQRLSRDLWQFDQQACSSPHWLFVECKNDVILNNFLGEMKTALERENQEHPWQHLPADLSSSVWEARTKWLTKNENTRAEFPLNLGWTILVGEEKDLEPAHFARVLQIIRVDSLTQVLNHVDRNTQVVGVGFSDRQKESDFAKEVINRGAERVSKLGQMHVFGSPWDGQDLVRPLMRKVMWQQSSETTR